MTSAAEAKMQHDALSEKTRNDPRPDFRIGDKVVTIGDPNDYGTVHRIDRDGRIYVDWDRWGRDDTIGNLKPHLHLVGDARRAPGRTFFNVMTSLPRSIFRGLKTVFERF